MIESFQPNFFSIRVYTTISQRKDTQENDTCSNMGKHYTQDKDGFNSRTTHYKPIDKKV